MSILVIGGTGHVGSLVVQGLADIKATANILTKDPSKTKLPSGMTAVKGDLLDPPSLRAVLQGVDTMFLLASVSPAELAQSLIAIDLAHEAEVRHVVYWSQNKLDWPDCPHAVAKAAAENLIRHHRMKATILRPAYFFQNDIGLKDAIAAGNYPIPVGNVGAQMVDVHDIAEIAAKAILDEDLAGDERVVELVGPDVITGNRAAEIWSDVSGKPVAYGGDDIGITFENKQVPKMPPWQAHDLVAMFRGCQREGMIGAPGSADRFAKLLGRPLRTYRAFAEETLKQWQKQ